MAGDQQPYDHGVQGQTYDNCRYILQAPQDCGPDRRLLQQGENAVKKKQSNGIADIGLVDAAGYGHQSDGSQPAEAVPLRQPHGQRVQEQGGKVGVRREHKGKCVRHSGERDQERGDQKNADRVGKLQKPHRQAGGPCDHDDGDQAEDYPYLVDGTERGKEPQCPAAVDNERICSKGGNTAVIPEQ